jgi:hypothetical protein
MDNETTAAREDADPLVMARVLTRQVDQLAHAAASDDGRLQSVVAGWGNRQHQAAEMAAQLALVSIAADLRRIADHLAGGQ